MTGWALHVARKDLRQHRAWIAIYLVVLVVRALLVASGIDVHAAGRNQLAALGTAYQVLCVLHVALLVTLAVQLVQGDRLVGTTAFWLTRPVARGALLASKLGLAFTLLVFLPAVLDAVVVTASGLAWLDALGAVAEGLLLRLAVVLPIMTLAAVTGDLAVFVVTTIAVGFGTVALQAGIQWLDLVVRKNRGVEESLLVTVAGMALLGSLVALAHQVFTRRTLRTALMLAATVLLTVAAANRLEHPFLQAPRTLEAGWLDPARVSVTVRPLPPTRLPGPWYDQRPWLVPAASDITGATPNVVLAPFGFITTLTAGEAERYEAVHQNGWGGLTIGSGLWRKELVEHLLGGVQLIDARDASPRAADWWIARLTDASYRRYVEHGGRFDADVVLGALAYEPCQPLPLRHGARGRCGDRQIQMISAAYRDGQCHVSLRDVMAGFTIDLRRPSRVVYLLVNQASRQGLAFGERDYFGRFPVFGRATFVMLTEHVAVTRRDLVFEAPRNMPALGPEWLKEAVIVPLQIRDIGQFTVKANVRAQ